MYLFIKVIIFLHFVRHHYVLAEYCSTIKSGSKCFVSSTRICPDGRKFIWKSIPICDSNEEICCLPTERTNATETSVVAPVSLPATTLAATGPGTKSVLETTTNNATERTTVYENKSTMPASSCGRPAASTLLRMIGGQYVASDCQWPWLVMIRYDTGDGRGFQNLLTGALIRSDVVVANGASINELMISKDRFPGLRFQVKVGAYDLTTQGETEDIPVELSDVLIHEDFRDSPLGTTYLVNDIALLRLRRDVTLSRCRYPVCLPEGESDSTGIAYGEKCKLVGWGQLVQSQDQPQSKPLEADVIYINRYICGKMSGVLTLPPGTTCAITHENAGVRTCALDKGNIVICMSKDDRWLLRGLVSVTNCQDTETPFILSDVAFHNSWIQSKLDAWSGDV